MLERMWNFLSSRWMSRLRKANVRRGAPFGKATARHTQIPAHACDRESAKIFQHEGVLHLLTFASTPLAMSQRVQLSGQRYCSTIQDESSPFWLLWLPMGRGLS